jgi:hypothetical protein
VKIPSVEAEFFHADGKADEETERGRQARRYDEALMVVFRNFTIAPKKMGIFLEFVFFVKRSISNFTGCIKLLCGFSDL